jgi:protein-tyrosine phosphatase
MAKYRDQNISKITDYLYLSAWPEGKHRDEILERNIRLILCMHYRLPEKALRQSPLRLIWLPTIDTPLTPVPISFLRRGAKEALVTIREGNAVLVHCKYGVHRSVAMVCCVMIATGYQAQEAMQIVKDSRPVADPYISYVQCQILRFEQAWKKDTT